MNWFDSHCHLEACADGPIEAITSAVAAGVSRMVTIGTDYQTSAGAVAIAEANDGVWATVGVDPQCLDTWHSGSITELNELASNSTKVVAVGEIGLDYFRDHSPRQLQRDAFEMQLSLAKSLNKAVVLHVRDALDDVIAILGNIGVPQRLVFHCFSGDEHDARRALNVGGYISFAGNVSFKNAEGLRSAARVVPLDRLLVETDSPYLAPVPYRGRSNQPSFVVEVGHAVAAARDERISDIALRTFENACLVFGI
ncbi:MAG: TatD family hydrolase [Actinomycetota bacterium]